MSASEKGIGIAAVIMAVCCAVLPVAGGALAGGLALGAGTLGVVAGVIVFASTPGVRASQAQEPPLLSTEGRPRPTAPSSRAWRAGRELARRARAPPGDVRAPRSPRPARNRDGPCERARPVWGARFADPAVRRGSPQPRGLRIGARTAGTAPPPHAIRCAAEVQASAGDRQPPFDVRRRVAANTHRTRQRIASVSAAASPTVMGPSIPPSRIAQAGSYRREPDTIAGQCRRR